MGKVTHFKFDRETDFDKFENPVIE